MASLSKKESRKAIKHSSSAKGMKPLVDLVAAAQADLDESEKAQLALMPDEEHVGEEEEEKEDDDEEEEDSDEEEDDEELGGEDGHDGTEGESALHEDGDDVRDVRFSRSAVTHWDNLC